MTDEQLRAYWGEGPPPPRPTGKLDSGTVLVLWAVGVAVLLVLAALILPGMAAEGERARQREIRVCELSKVMSGETDAAGAALLCARGWER